MNKFAFKKSLISLCVTTLFLQACAGASTRSSSVDDSIQAPVIIDKPVEVAPVAPNVELYGPPAPNGENQVIAPTASTPKEPKVCVVLGPGMAKALAELSALDALMHVGLPIRCVVGTEMGAVIGALFARANGNTNPLAWELFKLNKASYFNFPLFSIREPKSTGAKLHELFESIFHGGQIEALPMQFAAMATDSGGGAVSLSHGNISDALSASVAIPGVFEAWHVGEQDLVSGAISSPLGIEAATAFGADFIVAVSVLEDGGVTTNGAERFQRAFTPVRNLLKLQKRDAKELIQIHLPMIPYDDFSRQAEIFAIGKEVAEKEALRVKADWDAFSAHSAEPTPKAEHP